MFVKKIPRWKIKRFIKGVIRSILFFVILSSFSFSAFALPSNGVYDNFDSWVGDGSVDYLLRSSNSEIIKSGSFYGDDSNLNVLYVANNEGPFDHVRLIVGNDSPNIQQSFKAGDTILLRQNIGVYVRDGVVNPLWKDKFTISIHTIDNDFVSHELSFRGEDCLVDSYILEESHGYSCFFYIELNALIGNYDGFIESISYHFYEITADAYYFQVEPSVTSGFPYSNNGSLTYYIGPQSNAPIFNLPDDKPLTDLEDSEGALLDDFDNVQEDFFKRFHQPNLTDFESWANNFWSQQGGSFGNWLAAASGLFSILWDSIPWHIRNLIQFLLVFGVLGFVLNIISRLRKE